MTIPRRRAWWMGLLLAGAVWAGPRILADEPPEPVDPVRGQQVAEAMTTLTHVDPVMRQRAAVTLWQLKDPAASEALARALDDADVKVREWAAKALSALGSAGIPGLVHGLGNESVKVRRTSLRALTLVGLQAMPLLIAALDDPDPAMQWQASIHLLSLGEPLGLLRLTHTPVEGDERRLAFVQALGGLKNWRALAPLTQAAADPDPLIREDAVKQLAWYGPSALTALTAALRDRSHYVRQQSVMALKKILDPRSVAALEGALSDAETVNRRLALESLALMGPSAWSALQRAADRHPRPEIRTAAREALGSLTAATLSAVVEGALSCLRRHEPFTVSPAVMTLVNLDQFHPLVITALGSVLEDPDWDVRLMAVKGLAVRGRSALPWLSLAVKDPSVQVRREAAMALGVLRDPAGFPVLIEMAGQTDRALAHRGLSQVDGYGPYALPILASALASVNHDVAEAAIGWLGRLSDEESLYLLTTQAFHDHLGMRVQTALALGRLGHPRAVPLLAVMAQDPDPGVRQLAVRSLIQYGAAAGWALMDSLGDPDASVRLWAMAAAGLYHVLPGVPSLLNATPHPVLAMSLYAEPPPSPAAWAEAQDRVLTGATPADRQRALFALNTVDADASQTRTAALKDADLGVRHAALAGCRGHRMVSGSALAACGDRSQNIGLRLHALLAAARLPEAEGLPLLMRATGDADRDVRLTGLLLLARLPPIPSVTAMITRLTNDPDALIQRVARDLLAKRNGVEADLMKERESPNR